MTRRLLPLVFVLTLLIPVAGAEEAKNPVPTGNAIPLPKASPPSGILAPWDVKQMLKDLNAQTQKLKPLLQQMKPQQWLDNGAPPAYVTQYQDALARVDDTVRAANALSQQTESLSLALEAYFRMEALEDVAHSVEQCVRKYGDRPTADQLAQLIAEDFTNRQKLRSYLEDLSVTREQQFKVADAEAQRCRGIISKETLPGRRPRQR